MRAIVLAESGRLDMQDVPKPEPRAGHVRIRTAACAICATDLEMMAGDDRVRRPAILGHEWAGTVDAAASPDDVALVGKPCVAENVLSDGGEVGFEHPGGYGAFLVTEAANVHLLPDDLPMPVATLVEPLAVCVRAMRRLGAADERPALVFGDGPIGLLMLALLKRAGAETVLLVGGRPGRLRVALGLGADEIINYHAASDLTGAICGGAERAFASVIEASGSPAGLEAALDAAAADARVLVLGDYGRRRVSLVWNRILHKELHLIGSNASAGTWPEAVEIAGDPQFPLAHLVSARFPAERFDEAVNLVRSRRDDVVKVVLEWA